MALLGDEGKVDVRQTVLHGHLSDVETWLSSSDDVVASGDAKEVTNMLTQTLRLVSRSSHHSANKKQTKISDSLRKRCEDVVQELASLLALRLSERSSERDESSSISRSLRRSRLRRSWRRFWIHALARRWHTREPPLETLTRLVLWRASSGRREKRCRSRGDDRWLVTVPLLMSLASGSSNQDMARALCRGLGPDIIKVRRLPESAQKSLERVAIALLSLRRRMERVCPAWECVDRRLSDLLPPGSEKPPQKRVSDARRRQEISPVTEICGLLSLGARFSVQTGLSSQSFSDLPLICERFGLQPYSEFSRLTVGSSPYKSNGSVQTSRRGEHSTSGGQRERRRQIRRHFAIRRRHDREGEAAASNN